MILKAKHNKLLLSFFRFYTLWKLKHNFQEIEIIGTIDRTNQSSLIISNHISWWDGFWIFYLNLKTIKKKFHFMMLEDQLKKYWIFNHTGGYSIRKNSRSAMESIHYTCELLNKPGNAVLIFPQGEINSMHNSDIKFEKGINKILSSVTSNIQIIFVACFIDYDSKPNPFLKIYITEYSLSDNVESQYQCFYNSCIQKQIIVK